MTKTHKVLCDLALGHQRVGFSGIPQDTRLLFSGLLESKQVDVSGLIMGVDQDVFSFYGDNEWEDVSVFLGNYLNGQEIIRNYGLLEKVLKKTFPSIHSMARRYIDSSPYQFNLNDIPGEFKNSVWRQFFSATLDSDRQESIQLANFLWTRMSISRISHATLGRLRQCELNTKGIDFLLLQDSRPIKVSSNTKKIIRYHDALPVFSSDTMKNQLQTLDHIRSIKACENDSVYVCNSDSSLDELANLSPIAAEHARVIPYFLPKIEKSNTDKKTLKSICDLRRSPSTKKDASRISTDSWFKSGDDIPDYILSLATIEPRKNFIGLINAWSKLRNRSGKDIKLMIVGRPGWEFEATLKTMRPFVESGDLLHLEGVAQHELSHLYSSASCFVFPSFGEGFGLPPNEAMQCDCPVAMSDIPAHRYSAGEAALYFNPYDTDDMANKIGTILDQKPDSALLKSLRQKGRQNVERYSIQTVLPLWEKLFSDLNK